MFPFNLVFPVAHRLLVPAEGLHVYPPSKQLHARVAKLHLYALGGALTVFAQEHAVVKTGVDLDLPRSRSGHPIQVLYTCTVTRWSKNGRMLQTWILRQVISNNFTSLCITTGNFAYAYFSAESFR